MSADSRACQLAKVIKRFNEVRKLIKNEPFCKKLESMSAASKAFQQLVRKLFINEPPFKKLVSMSAASKKTH